jgi:large subunit ribosomal protein L20
MTRIKRGVLAHKKKRTIRKSVKGFLSTRRGSIKRAKEAILKAGTSAYRDRKKKKHTMRALWQMRINAAARLHGLSYSKFIALLKVNKIGLDRKILAQLATDYPVAFGNIVEKVKVKK